MRKIRKRAVRALLPIAALALVGATACGPGMDTDAQPAPADGVVLNEPEIAGIVMTANTGEIELGQLALSKSRNQAVREFAQRMITDHTAVNQQIQTIASQTGVQPQETTTTRQLRQNVMETAEALRTMEGQQFDEAYMENQVATHRWLLDTLDRSLIPASEGDVRAALEDYRRTVADHLQQAQRVQGML